MEQENLYAAPQSQIRSEQAGYSDSPTVQLASRMQRLGAYTLDVVLAMVVYMPIVGVAFVSEASGADSETMTVLIFVVFGLGLLAFAGVNLYLLYRDGQTIGKRLVGIKIVRGDLVSRASLLRIIFLRTLPVWVVNNIPCMGIFAVLGNYLVILGDERRCGHDYLADTHVVVVGSGGDDPEPYSGYLESSSSMSAADGNTNIDGHTNGPANANRGANPGVDRRGDAATDSAVETGVGDDRDLAAWDPGNEMSAWEPGELSASTGVGEDAEDPVFEGEGDGDASDEDGRDDEGEWDYSTDKGF